MSLHHGNLVVWDTNWNRPDVDAVSLYQSALSSTCPLPLLCCHLFCCPPDDPHPENSFLFFPNWLILLTYFSPFCWFCPFLGFSAGSFFHPGCSALIWPCTRPLREQLTWSELPAAQIKQTCCEGRRGGEWEDPGKSGEEWKKFNEQDGTFKWPLEWKKVDRSGF